MVLRVVVVIIEIVVELLVGVLVALVPLLIKHIVDVGNEIVALLEALVVELGGSNGAAG